MYNNLQWLSDWNGYEVGYDDVNVVGLWRIKDTEFYVYIDYEDDSILECWYGEEED